MKSCDIHDLLRDLCLKVSEEQELYHVRGSVRGTERRLIYGSVWFVSKDTPLARCIMAYEFSYLRKHRLLRLLDVRNGHCSLEKLISEYVNLRYLALGCTSSRLDLKLPTSVSLVWNLQTLNFRKYAWLTRVVAPIEIWKMRQLRHIECHEIYLPHPSPSNEQDDVPVLENLQTLRNAVNFKFSEDVCNIIPNIKILQLTYDLTSPGWDDCLIKCLCNLDRLHKLESLKVRAECQWPFRRNIEMNKILAFPNSLNKLSLSYCRLHWEDMAMIGSLPHLEVLKLERYSFTKGEQWNPVDGQFLRLKFLKINLCKLIRWNADSSHFPVLQKLVLCGLSELEGIPPDIGEVTTLQLIHMDGCSNSAMISALQIKEDRLEYEENDDLQIIMRNYERESFMKMVETEGLTINNVQFKTR